VESCALIREVGVGWRDRKYIAALAAAAAPLSVIMTGRSNGLALPPARTEKRAGSAKVPAPINRTVAFDNSGLKPSGTERSAAAARIAASIRGRNCE